METMEYTVERIDGDYAYLRNETRETDELKCVARARLRRELIETIVHMGYPEEFGAAVADNLRTEKTMSRMIGYLHHARPRSMEEIADEMLAIMEDRERWIRKKSAEYYNMKYNEMRDWMAEAAESGELEEPEEYDG